MDNALPLTMQSHVVHLVMRVCVDLLPCRGIIGGSLYAEVELDRNIVQAIDNGENINNTLMEVVEQVSMYPGLPLPQIVIVLTDFTGKLTREPAVL